MAICKRPASAVVTAMGGARQALKRGRVVVAKRTWPSRSTGPSSIKKPAAACYGTTADYEDRTLWLCLGEGAFGVVYRARHRATGQAVAIKFLAPLPPDVASVAPDPREQLLREARFLEACDGNPNVVGFHGVVRDPSTTKLGLVMELVDGQSLRDLLDERRAGGDEQPLPEATVRAHMRQLLKGAKGMQDRGVVHRDIKPANLLVAGSTGVLKICDFGLAISTSDPPPHSEAGTMLYTAPEVLAGKPDPDALVDAWSIGCVMAELVGGGEILLLRAGVEAALIDLRPCAEEIAYLWTIFGLLGTPDEVTWPGFASLPRAAKMPPLKLGQRSRLRELFPEETLSEEGFEVMNGLLTCNPEKRLTAAEALKLPWFAGDAD